MQRLTEMVSCAGCAGKLDADHVVQVLQRIPQYPNPNVLVGYDTADDAGVFRIDDERALVQTVDFFTPIVDDPYTYGAIAAANSLSDVYAMGGRPITALAITCFPNEGVEIEMLSQIMHGGVEKLKEAGVALVGGHTVADKEIKFGYSITGLVNPNHIVTNSAARPGDALVLTKPLGIGILTSGIKYNQTSREAAQEAVFHMTTLNYTASEIMLRHETHAATDITGNGLLGHGYEMAEGSRTTLRFQADCVPFIEEAFALAKAGVLPGRVAKTWKMIEKDTLINPGISTPLKNILLDPQTSGGLLIAVSPNDLDGLLEDLTKNNVNGIHVGRVEETQGYRIIVD
jgi:selenide, water dikinase